MELWPLMVFDLRENFVSARCLENGLMDFEGTCKFQIPKIINGDMVILIIELRSLLAVRIAFPFNILRGNWWNLTSYAY